MRNRLAVSVFATALLASGAALAQSTTVEGAANGARAGGEVGGPVGAMVGGTVGAASPLRIDVRLARIHQYDARVRIGQQGRDPRLEARQRLAGWRATLENAGVEVPPPLIGDWSAKSGYELGQLLARMPEVKAIFAANDSMALGVLRALHEHGRAVPDEVSLVGFDDMPEAAYFTPPLTTVRQDFGEVGRRSLALLVDQIESGARAAKRLVIGTSLVVRESTTAAGRAG